MHFLQQEVNGEIPPTALKSSSQTLTLKSLKHDDSLAYLSAESGTERMGEELLAVLTCADSTL